MPKIEKTYIDDAGNLRRELVDAPPREKSKVRYEWNYKGQIVKAFDVETGTEIRESGSRRGWL